MSDLINLYIYYEDMAAHYVVTEWNYPKFCQFSLLADAVLRKIKADYVEEAER